MATYGGSDIDAMLRSMQNMMRLEQTVGQVQARGEYTRERESLQQELDRLEEQEKEAAKGYGTAERKGQKASSEKFLKNLLYLAAAAAATAYGAPALAGLLEGTGVGAGTIATLEKLGLGVQKGLKFAKGIPAVAGISTAAAEGIPGVVKGATQAGAETFERETRGIPTEFEYQPPQEKMTFLKPKQRETQVLAEELGEEYGEEGTMREIKEARWEPLGTGPFGLANLPSPAGIEQIQSVLGPYLMLLGIFGDKSKAADIVLQQGTGGPLALPGAMGSVINPFKAA